MVASATVCRRVTWIECESHCSAYYSGMNYEMMKNGKIKYAYLIFDYIVRCVRVHRKFSSSNLLFSFAWKSFGGRDIFMMEW